MDGEVATHPFPILRNAIENDFDPINIDTIKSEDIDEDEKPGELEYDPSDLTEMEDIFSPVEPQYHGHIEPDPEPDPESHPLPLEVQLDTSSSETSSTIYICEVCGKDKRDYNTLGAHRSHVHKLPWRQERLGPTVSYYSD